MLNHNNDGAQAPSNFLERVKKQAKKLFTLSKQNQISLDNLSAAQDLIAQINGYPSWHALKTVIDKKVESEKDENIPQLVFTSPLSSDIKICLHSLQNNHSLMAILGSAGTGKTVMCKNIVHSNFIERSVPIKTAIITTGNEYNNNVEAINRILKSKVGLNLNFKDFKTNLFDIPLGFLNYSEEMFRSIFLMLLTIIKNKNSTKVVSFNDIYPFMFNLVFEHNFVEKVSDLYKYKPGVSKEIDEHLEIVSLDALGKNWRDLSHELLVSSNEKLAKIAARLASPTVLDFIHFGRENLDILSSEDRNLALESLDALSDFFNKNQEFTHQTNWEVENYKLLNFNLSNYQSKNVSPEILFAGELAQHTIVNHFFRKYDLEVLTKWGNPEDFPNYWHVDRSKGWSHLVDLPLKAFLRNYQYINRDIDFNQLICDEALSYETYYMVGLARDSRKLNIGLVISSQDLKFKENLIYMMNFVVVDNLYLNGLTKSEEELFFRFSVQKNSNKHCWRLYVYDKEREHCIHNNVFNFKSLPNIV